MSDISALYSETAELVVLHPVTKEPIGIYATIYSPESKVMRSAEKEWRSKALLSGTKNLKSEDIDRELWNRVATSIASWRWDEGLTWQGEEPRDTMEFKLKVVSSPEGAFIRNQIVDLLERESNFFSV